jgi:hypothetical protein
MAFGLARFDLNDLTRRIEFPEISADPKKPITLIVRAAGEGNRAWTSAQFKRPVPEQPKDATRTPWDTDAGRDRIVAIFAEAILVGWENVYDEADPSNPVPFSVEAAERFLRELIARVADVWLRLWIEVDDRKKFRPTVDPVDLGKG